MSSSRYPRGERRHIRVLDRGLVDEEGRRMDIDGDFDGTTLDLAAIAAADRFIHLDGRGAPRAITAAQLTLLAQAGSADGDVCLVRYVGNGYTVIGIDTSDCPA